MNRTFRFAAGLGIAALCWVSFAVGRYTGGSTGESRLANKQTAVSTAIPVNPSSGAFQAASLSPTSGSPFPTLAAGPPTSTHSVPADNGREQVTAYRLPAEKQIKVDGSYQFAPPDSYLLEYGDKTYVPTDLIRELYAASDYDGIIIRGLPFLEDTLVETSGIVELTAIFDDLKKRFEVQMNNGDYTDLTEVHSGMTISWGEPGLRQLILTTPKYMTTRGIHVGSTREEVQQAYGSLGQPEDESWRTFGGVVELSEGAATQFLFEGDVVTEIRYGWL